MKTFAFTFFLINVLLLSPFAGDLVAFRIDKNHSNISFNVPIQKGLSKVSGKFSDFKLDLKYDDADITKSTVEVMIQAKSIDTGIDQRDGHLRSPDFFDVEKFPEITFKSKQVIKRGEKLILVGDFTMHGVTKEISFPFEFTGKSTDDLGERGKMFNLGFSANLTLNRKDFGVNYQHKVLPEFIGNEVEININLITLGKRLEPSK